MILETDIGIDINGLMYVLFKQGINLPSEESFVIDIKDNNDIMMHFYQGQRVYVKDNTLIGKLQLTNTKSGRFELKCILTHNSLKLIINDYMEEYSFINKISVNEISVNEMNEIIVEEEKIRNLEIAKTKYINYINQTLCTLEQIKDKIDPYLIYKIKEAYEIIYVDISIEEYEEAQKQIEGWINPLLENI
jgi:molecular chaperone DnaK (HSP70)